MGFFLSLFLKLNKMQVRFLEVMAGTNHVYNTEDVYEIENKTAKRYIEHGICVEHTNKEIEVVTISNDAVVKPAKKAKNKPAKK